MNFYALQVLILLFCIIRKSIANESFPKTRTPLGRVRGLYKISYENKTYKSFTNIPFAKPPIGELRFQPPEPINPWTGELDATKNPSTCIQFTFFSDKIIGTEDCLYLNIFVPNVENTHPLPVLFNIHGGAFTSGSSGREGPKYFMDKNLILVTTNYRVGPMGFLSTGDEVLSGNMGLKDQSLALKWVSDNIKYFGGDPKRVTIAGCSAGAASVHYHYLSPMSAGLFQNGISMSGNTLNPWALAKDPMPTTLKMANILNCPSDNSKNMVKCFKKLPAHEICKAGYKLLWSEYLHVGIDRPPFVPVVEKIEKNYFINQLPEKIFESKKANDVPWIVGIVSEEGIQLAHGYVFNQTSLTYIDKNWDNVGPYMMFLQDEVPKEKFAEVAKLARQHYFGNESFVVSDEMLKKFVYFTGDKGFSYDSERAAVLQAKSNKSPVQMYYYNYRAAQSYSHFLLKTDKDYGVSHADDSLMIFENDIVNPTTRLQDIQMTKILLQMMHTYTETGQANLGFEWPKVDPNSEYLQYLHISGPDKMNIRSTDNLAEKKFWKSIGF